MPYPDKAAVDMSLDNVGVELRRCRKSWSRGDHGRRRNLQGKSKSELEVLQQDPPTLSQYSTSIEMEHSNGILAEFRDNA